MQCIFRNLFIDFIFSVVSTQSDVLKVQQVLTSSSQTQGNTEETRVVMVDKVIHVSEVTSEKVAALPIHSREAIDNPQNPALGADHYGETIDQINSKTRREDILPRVSRVLGSTEEISKGNNGQDSENC